MYQTAPTKMNDPGGTTFRKSKLVTISSTSSENDAFANFFPKFTFKGSSRSQKTEVEMSFPSFLGNLMFYEQYRESDADFPYMLSFMYLGRNTKGQLNYNFQHYKTVETAEFVKEFQSVNLIFQVIHQLPKCREIRIHLDDDNFLLSTEDLASIERRNEFPCKSSTVKVLKIIRYSNCNDSSLDSRTRFAYIMDYALHQLPNLEQLHVVGMDGGGASYDLVNYFCKMKCKPMPKHNITIRDGRTYCEPQVYPHSPDQPCSKSRNIITQDDRNVPGNVMKPSNGCCSTGRNEPTIAPMKQETRVQNYDPVADVEVFPVSPPPPTPKKVLATITISDDENEASPPKKPKRESLHDVAEQRQLDAASPASTVSMSSTAACVTSNPSIPEQSSSLTSISSSYNNDWESSSDDEREKLLNPPNPERKSMDKRSVVKNELGQVSDNVGNDEGVIYPNFAAVPMDVDELRNILNVANGISAPLAPRKVSEKVKPKPKNKEIFREGIHFDRRPKP